MSNFDVKSLLVKNFVFCPKIAGFIQKLAEEFNPGSAGCREWHTTAGIGEGWASVIPPARLLMPNKTSPLKLLLISFRTSSVYDTVD